MKKQVNVVYKQGDAILSQIYENAYAETDRIGDLHVYAYGTGEKLGMYAKGVWKHVVLWVE